MIKKFLLLLLFIPALYVHGQQVTLTVDQVKAITPEWKGERFPDGRPRVSDKMLERLKKVHLEEAWGVLRNKGYMNQFEGDWMVINPDSVMVGRALTAQYSPSRPDYDKLIRDKGKAEGRIGSPNSWPTRPLWLMRHRSAMEPTRNSASPKEPSAPAWLWPALPWRPSSTWAVPLARRHWPGRSLPCIGPAPASCSSMRFTWP